MVAMTVKCMKLISNTIVVQYPFHNYILSHIPERAEPPPAINATDSQDDQQLRLVPEIMLRLYVAYAGQNTGSGSGSDLGLGSSLGLGSG